MTTAGIPSAPALAREADRPFDAVRRPWIGKTISALQLGLGWFPEHPGGLDRYYFDLIRALPDAGVDCTGLVVGTDSAEKSTGGRVRAFAAHSDSLAKRLMRLRTSIAEVDRGGGIDLWVSHFALYASAARGLMGGTPSVVHFHGPWAGESRAEGASRAACWVKARVERAVYAQAERLICLSTAFGEILSSEYRIAPERIRVVPGGVDVERFNPPESRAEARRRMSWPTDRPIILCVRRLVRRMGLGNLIEAAAVLRRQVPDALVLIAGKGPLSGELGGQIDRLGLGQSVRLLGYIPDDDLPLAYRAADLTVVPSVSLEGFGLAAAESLAAGTPALVTKVGGLPDIVEGLGDQWVLPDPSPAGIAQRLAEHLKGAAPALSSAQCIAHARARFDWPVIARRIRDVYAEAIGL